MKKNKLTVIIAITTRIAFGIVLFQANTAPFAVSNIKETKDKRQQDYEQQG